MTTVWHPSGEWAGETVVILGCGPAMSEELAEELRPLGKVIAVNHACTVAPWADLLVALDAPWPEELRAFEGARVCGVDVPGLDALYPGPMGETVVVGRARLQIRNSGLAAVRIAAGLGAKRIILAGFSPESGRHFYDDTPHVYTGVAEGLAALTAELASQGVTVERYTA